MTEKKIKVLVLADSRAFHTERYVEELKRQNCEVLLASLERGDIDHYRLRVKGPFSQLYYVLATSEVKDLINKFRPDIINPHYVSGYGFTAALAQAWRYAPVLAHIWGSDILIVPAKSIFHKRKIMYALKHADYVLADSDYLIECAQAIKRFPNYKVIPWGIEEKYLQYHKKDYSLNRPLKIIVPRRHEKVYNNRYLVQVLSFLITDDKVSMTFPDFGRQFGNFMVNARMLVGERIKTYPRLEREELMKLMAEHDVYMTAAVSDSSPASMLEAMALGLIPVAPDLPGMKEWLNESSGYTYSLNHPDELFNIVRKLALEDDNHEKIRQANLEHIKREAIFEKNVADTIDIMRQLISKRNK